MWKISSDAAATSQDTLLCLFHFSRSVLNYCCAIVIFNYLHDTNQSDIRYFILSSSFSLIKNNAISTWFVFSQFCFDKAIDAILNDMFIFHFLFFLFLIKHVYEDDEKVSFKHWNIEEMKQCQPDLHTKYCRQKPTMTYNGSESIIRDLRRFSLQANYNVSATITVSRKINLRISTFARQKKDSALSPKNLRRSPIRLKLIP